MRRLLLGFTALACTAAALLAQAPPSPAGAPAAATVDPSAFFFIQLSDPQFGMFTGDKAFDQETANFEFAVASVNRLKPAFVVITGDLVNKPGDGPQMAEYDRIRRKLAPGIPVYEMAGNHDIENEPTPATVAAYRTKYGRDHYTFRYKSLIGVVLNSTLIHTPTKVPQELADQDTWLRAELVRAHGGDARHVVVFQHHPWFLKTADETDGYFNIPRVRRDPLLALFRENGVKLLVSGHYHQNAVAADAGFDAITTGPVGKPLGGARSGFRIFRVTDTAITHKYVEFGDVPTAVDLGKF